MDKAVEYVVSCKNFDGGFGVRPGSESHSGQVSLGISDHFTNYLYHQAFNHHFSLLHSLQQN